MKLETLERNVEIPEGVEVNIDNSLVKVKGPKGEVVRALKFPKVNIEKKENMVNVYSKNASRNEKRMICTFSSHIQNMVKGANEGFVYKLKVCSGHFPMKVNLEGKTVVVNNFLGERVPRKANVLEGVEVKIDGDVITVEGVDIEKTAQTAANIEKSTRVTNRDRRIFMDGIWITSKAGKEI